MILTRNIQKMSSEKVFLVVQNECDTTMTVGRGACWNFFRSGDMGHLGRWDGCGVTMFTSVGGGHSTAISKCQYAFAGVIGPEPISPGAWGLVQAFGYVSRMAFGHQATDWMQDKFKGGYGGGNVVWVPHYFNLSVTWTLGSGIFARMFYTPSPDFPYRYNPRSIPGFGHWAGQAFLVTSGYIRKLSTDVYEATGFVHAL